LPPDPLLGSSTSAANTTKASPANISAANFSRVPTLCSLPFCHDEQRAAENFYCLGKEVQNRSGQKLCVEGTEDRRFCKYFSYSVHTAINVCDLLNQHEKLDPGTDVTKMLWAMYFLKCYPLTQEACAAAGEADGAIDPKTWKKYI
jgi:hypothetical protein